MYNEKTSHRVTGITVLTLNSPECLDTHDVLALYGEGVDQAALLVQLPGGDEALLSRLLGCLSRYDLPLLYYNKGSHISTIHCRLVKLLPKL